MPCFHPIQAWRTGDGPIQFKPGGAQTLKLPCGRCIGCRLDRSKQWAIRLMNEAQLHERTAFITLTYDNNSCPGGLQTFGLGRPPDPLTRTHPTDASASGKDRTVDSTCQDSLTRPPSSYLVAQTRSLNKQHLQNFLRSLRKDLYKRRGLQAKIRYFACGEYGEKLGRPHYHLALFGEDFREDRYIWRTELQTNYYRSALLEKHWPHGHSEIGNLTIESAAYIARYVCKKITGKQAETHYRKVDTTTGETHTITPEFSVMSLKPGIGKEWIEKYRGDVYPHDYVVHNGRKLKPPRYYDKLLEMIDAGALEQIKAARKDGIHKEDNTPARLAVREDCLKAKMAFTKRKLENQ